MENASGAMGGGTRSNRVGRWDGGGTMDGAMSSGRYPWGLGKITYSLQSGYDTSLTRVLQRLNLTGVHTVE